LKKKMEKQHAAEADAAAEAYLAKKVADEEEKAKAKAKVEEEARRKALLSETLNRGKTSSLFA